MDPWDSVWDTFGYHREPLKRLHQIATLVYSDGKMRPTHWEHEDTLRHALNKHFPDIFENKRIYLPGVCGDDHSGRLEIRVRNWQGLAVDVPLHSNGKFEAHSVVVGYTELLKRMHQIAMLVYADGKMRTTHPAHAKHANTLRHALNERFPDIFENKHIYLPDVCGDDHSGRLEIRVRTWQGHAVDVPLHSNGAFEPHYVVGTDKLKLMHQIALLVYFDQNARTADPKLVTTLQYMLNERIPHIFADRDIYLSETCDFDDSGRLVIRVCNWKGLAVDVPLHSNGVFEPHSVVPNSGIAPK